MITKTKITDGDLILINIEGKAITQRYIESVREGLKKWLSSRGLSNVELIVSGGETKISIANFSVNDVAGQELLGENNG